MTKYEYFTNILPIINPRFYIIKDKFGNELVFLDVGNKRERISNEKIDKTQTESFVNHFHLFNRFNKKHYSDIVKIGSEIANNLLHNLNSNFPDKKFIVYLEVNHNDSTIIRFHQIWDDEPLYFDVDEFHKLGKKIFEFKV